MILARELAALYGVSTKALNQAANRNLDRFPQDFVFQLSDSEWTALRSQFVTLKRGQHVKYLPFAFTEHGAVMAATLLKTKRAAEISVYVEMAFVRMRRMLADQRRFALRLDEIENKLAAHDQNLKVVFGAIRKLMERPKPKPEPSHKIGFHVSDAIVAYDVGGKRKKR